MTTLEKFQVKQAPGNIGRLAIITINGVHGEFIANVLDQVAGTTCPKRVRVQRDLQFGGKVLQPHQYQFMEWLDLDDD